jgi:hypothetical protein
VASKWAEVARVGRAAHRGGWAEMGGAGRCQAEAAGRCVEAAGRRAGRGGKNYSASGSGSSKIKCHGVGYVGRFWVFGIVTPAFCK